MPVIVLMPIYFCISSFLAHTHTLLTFTFVLPPMHRSDHIHGITDHLPLRGVARLGSSLGFISDLIGWEGSFIAFKGFK